MNERLHGDSLEEEDKILIAEQHFDDTPLRYYHARIKQEKRFGNYAAFAKWLPVFFTLADTLGKRHLDYDRIKQHENENLNQYQLRFTELLYKPDEQPSPS